jgi:hypothetical protein
MSFDLNLVASIVGIRVGSNATDDLVVSSSGSYSILAAADGTSIIFRPFSASEGAIDNISVRQLTQPGA